MSNQKSISVVELDALAFMKIVKHCRENLPEIVTGHLLGMADESTLQVTNCFAFPETT